MNSNNKTFQTSIHLAIGFTLLIWSIKIFEVVFGWNLHQLGVYPQRMSGLMGVITAPLIHGSWQHLISNTLPLILLGGFLSYGYPKSHRWTMLLIWLLSGIGVWLFGRESYHFGSSGLAHGMFFFLFIGGIIRRDKRSIALLMLAFFMYGSMLMTIFPREIGISYEYHFFGASAGAFCAFLFRHWDPKPIRKKYEWEDEEDDEVKEWEQEVEQEQKLQQKGDL